MTIVASPQNETAATLTVARCSWREAGRGVVMLANTTPPAGAVVGQAARSMGRPPVGRLTRWQAIVEAAAERSHRGAIPTVSGPVTLASALGEASDRRVLALEPSAALSLAQAIDGSAAYTIAVGPEGGWTDGELATLRARGAVAVNLGPRILRARLAPIVAAAILVQR